MYLQSGFSGEFLGTDTWVARVLGKIFQSDMQVDSVGEIQPHQEIMALTRELWQKTLDLRRDTILSRAAKEGKQVDVVIKDEQPLSALYSIREGDVERRVLFAGPSVTLVRYARDGGTLRVVHGLTNYAVRTLMNTAHMQ